MRPAMAKGRHIKVVIATTLITAASRGFPAIDGFLAFRVRVRVGVRDRVREALSYGALSYDGHESDRRPYSNPISETPLTHSNVEWGGWLAVGVRLGHRQECVDYMRTPRSLVININRHQKPATTLAGIFVVDYTRTQKSNHVTNHTRVKV